MKKNVVLGVLLGLVFLFGCAQGKVVETATIKAELQSLSTAELLSLNEAQPLAGKATTSERAPIMRKIPAAVRQDYVNQELGKRLRIKEKEQLLPSGKLETMKVDAIEKIIKSKGIAELDRQGAFVRKTILEIDPSNPAGRALLHELAQTGLVDEQGNEFPAPQLAGSHSTCCYGGCGGVCCGMCWSGMEEPTVLAQS